MRGGRRGAAVPPAGFLSVVIPTRDRYGLLAEVAAALARQTLDPGRLEVIVVDNSAAPEPLDAILGEAGLVCDWDVIPEAQPGASRCRNLGIAEARGEVVAVLDDDAPPDPGWAQALVAGLAAHPEAGAIGGPVVPIWPVRRPGWLPDWADDYLSILDWGGETRVLGPGEWIIGANMAFRADLLRSVGGFPEWLGRRGRLLSTNEDLVPVEALAALGHPTLYEPAMRVRHHVHAERLTPDWFRRRMAWQAVSDILHAAGDRPGDEPSGPARLRDALAASGPGSGLDALWSDPADPAEAAAQARATRLLLRILLVGPTEPEDAG